MKKEMILIGMLSMSFTFVSCESVTEAIEQAQSSGAETGDNAAVEQEEGFDDDYGNAMQDNFDDYDFEEGDDRYNMYDNQGGQQFRLPPRRPRQYSQYQNLQNDYGMATDGSRIICNNHQGSQGGLQFETNPSNLVDQNGDRRMIGVHRDGTPIYGHLVSHNDQGPQVDQYGGRFSETEDFPSGVYHYVIKISID